ncbi:MAG: extracellular solute-binding protein [Verrucomicrobiae bacterium]|nr:extracellular solute-binding protein [Verrucomicrobiae bacterium]
MRWFFATVFACLAAASLWLLVQSKGPDGEGRIVLHWSTDDNPARRDQIALFNRLHPGIEVRVEPSVGPEKALLQSVSGVGADLIDSYSIGHLQNFVSAGIAWDATEALAKRGVTKELTWPLAWSSFEIGDRLYGFPANVFAPGLWYHRDLFRKAGLEPPPESWTWDEFAARMKQVRAKLGDHDGVYPAVGEPTTIPTALMQSNGGRLFSEDGARCVLASRENAEALQFWQDLMYRDRILPTPVAEAAMSSQGGWATACIAAFAERRGFVGMSGGRWWLGHLRLYRDLDLGVRPFPYRKERRMIGGARVTLINRKSAHREAALEFLVFLASEPYSKLVDAQADGFGPLRKGRVPAAGDENDRAWRRILDDAVAPSVTPRVNYATADAALRRQLEWVRNRQKSPDRALADAQAEIDREMQLNLKAHADFVSRPKGWKFLQQDRPAK